MTDSDAPSAALLSGCAIFVAAMLMNTVPTVDSDSLVKAVAKLNNFPLLKLIFINLNFISCPFTYVDCKEGKLLRVEDKNQNLVTKIALSNTSGQTIGAGYMR